MSKTTKKTFDFTGKFLELQKEVKDAGYQFILLVAPPQGTAFQVKGDMTHERARTLFDSLSAGPSSSGSAETPALPDLPDGLSFDQLCQAKHQNKLTK